MFDDSIVIGFGNNSAISTPKIMKITAIRKNREENRKIVRSFLGRIHTPNIRRVNSFL
jgi:hypothetical protein